MNIETSRTQSQTRQPKPPRTRPVTFQPGRHRVAALVLLASFLAPACRSDTFPLFDQDGDGVVAGHDCNDNDPSIGSRYQDQDGDGFGAGSPLAGCDAPDSTGLAATDGDCDDRDADVYPGAIEVCNSVDDDCNGQVDEGFDQDQDGYRNCGEIQENDCDDTDPTVHPGADETCDGVDNDCDGDIDEDLTVTFFRDNDADGFGDDSTTITACSQPDGYLSTGGDCDDTDSFTYPGADETCDGVDNDCDGDIDEGAGEIYYPDHDHDGYGDQAAGKRFCNPPEGGEYTSDGGDCDDTDPSVYPDAAERCNTLDDDCDGYMDEGFVSRWFFVDNDGDGYGVTDQAVRLCADLISVTGKVPNGLAVFRGDCDDTRSDVYPGADESVANSIDEDCGGTVFADPFVVPPDTPDSRAIQAELPANLTPSGRTDYFTSIADAVREAKDDQTVWVAAGVYVEGPIDFGGRTIKLMSVAMAGYTIIKAANEGGLSPLVRFQTGESSATLLDGFTIQDAYNQAGGAIFISGSSPTVQNCMLNGNTATDGAAIYITGDSASPRLASLLVTENNAESRGGGIFVNSGTTTLVNCVVSGNQVQDSGGSGPESGGGIYVQGGTLLLDNVVIWKNYALLGGGIFATNSNITMKATSVNTNEASTGGGIYVTDDTRLTLENAVVFDNLAHDSGGGIYLAGSTVYLENAVLRENQANVRGDSLFVAGPPSEEASAVFSAVDSIFLGSDDDLQLEVENGVNFLAELTYCDIYPDFGETGSDSVVLGEGVLFADPKFMDEGASVVAIHLAADSPVINQGRPNLTDPDGSRNDMGYFGGPGADRWDLDGDGCPAYFWPGNYEDAPDGVTQAYYDPDDQDPLVAPCTSSPLARPTQQPVLP